MGWVRGQTGEQKEESKAKTSRGSGLVGSGPEDLGWAEGLGELHSLGGGERGGTPSATTPPDCGPSGEANGGAAGPFQRLGRERRGREGGGPQGRRASALHYGAAPPAPAGPVLGVGRVEERRADAGPPACRVAYSLSKAGLLNLQASL